MQTPDHLLQSEGYAAQLVARFAPGLAVLDASNRLVSANRTLLSLVGGDPAALYLMLADRALPVPELAPLIEQLRASGLPRVDGLGRLGAKRLRLAVMPLNGQPGLPEAVAVVLDDVTDLVRIGEELDRRSGDFDHLADAAATVLWEMDPSSWTITAVNRAAIDLTGFRDVHFLGCPRAWVDRIAEPDRQRTMERLAALQAGARGEVDYRFLRADDTEIWVRSRLGCSGNADDRRITAASFDITAARRDETLRLEAIAKIAGGVGHIVNNSMASVIGSIELHAEESGGVARIPLLQQAVTSCQRATDMASRLLVFAGQQTVRPATLSLADETRRALPRIREILGPAAHVDARCSDDTWRCRLDQELLLTALECLAANARDAIKTTGDVRIVTRNLTVERRHGSDVLAGDWVELEFADSGSGMTPDVRDRALEPFFSTRPLAESPGLGLSMVYGFVTQSGGHLRVQSEPGAGTVVRLLFPRAEAPDVSSDRPTCPTVLLVDDEVDVRGVTAAMLGRLGCVVSEAASGDEALQRAQALNPAVLVADIMLGAGPDGVEVARRLKSGNPQLAVILVSGYAHKHIDRSDWPPDFLFLPKPFTLASLAASLDAVTTRRAG